MKTVNLKDCPVKFGEFIRLARERKCLSQTEVAERAGISQPYFWYLERGERNVDLFLAMKICKIVGADMREFVDQFL